ncbi:MAG: LytTR family DNA-binding domain-containing protein [Bacteroidota bacterium]
MKYACLLVDDNLIELDALEHFVKKTDQLQIVARCNSAIEALQILNTTEVDIVFSDIDMPDLKGIDMIRTLKNPPVFVLISAHAEYALESYELDVADYMLKPIDFIRFLKAANKAMEICNTRKQLSEKPQVGSAENFNPAEDHFMIRTDNNYLKIRFNDIEYIESMSNYSKIYTADDKVHIVLVSLKRIEEALPPAKFMRVHRSFIIPQSKIEEIKPTELRIGKHLIPIGASYKDALMRNAVNQHLLSRNEE